MRTKEYGKGIIVAADCLLILFMAYVISASAGYTVFVGDDFTNSVRIGAFRVPFFEYFAASLHYMKDMYFDWQGTYFAMFIQALLSPLNNYGPAQLRIVMTINALLFFASVFGAVWTGLSLVMREKKELPIRLTLFTLLLFAVLDADVFYEVFFWYCGAAAYCIPFSFVFLSLMLLFLLNRGEGSERKKTVLCVLAALLLFLASGGPLIVSGVGCYAALLLTAGFYRGGDRKISVRNTAVTAAGVIGAIINTAAPGNYARHAYSGDDGGWQLFQAVKWTIKIVWIETERLVKETMFGVVLLAMLLLGIYLSKKIPSSLKVYGVISILAVGIGYVSVFPVVLGYGGTYFPNRCCFVLDTVLVISLCNLAIYAGCVLDRRADLHTDRRTQAVLLILLFAAVLLGPEKISDSALMAVAESKHNGTYRKYYEECVAVYDYLENCAEDDVVVEMPEYIDNFECFYLADDGDAWVNVGLAQYYHKNSVKRRAE